MKKNRFIKITLLFSSVIFSPAAFAQDGVAELAQLGPDATKLANAYLSPIFKGLGIGLNSGWANTAHSKNLGRFDIRIGVTGALVPGKDKTFDVSALGLSNRLELADPNKTLSPTVAAGKGVVPTELIVNNNSGDEVDRVTLPKGTNLPLIPSPQIQATVGLIKGIDVSLRAVPNIKLGNTGTINMIGGGVKVELLPLIAGKTAGKLLPFDLAVALGYTQFSYEKQVDDKSGLDDNQRIEAKISGVNVQTILSKKLLVFTPFIALGYNTSKTTGGLLGTYRVINPTLSTGVAPVYTTAKDPVSLDKKNFSSFRSDIGFQLNLAVIRFYASYSASEYNSFNAGLGLGFGK
ncbi:DUF6588 family protein [Paradesertivirga mongoliensis]|uniref:DUF6588 family protein n=1 Tax=Paradesertivirga mongoliensis TaxID=2100740 RepID=A0ABW4ZM35_9SPHI|nr:DUF6588 family protein [Pedobacter mongoliensis]